MSNVQNECSSKSLPELPWKLYNHFTSECPVAPQYVVVPTTDLYRRFSQTIPAENSVVVEIGCCNGFCTERIVQKLSSPETQYLGFDVAPKFIRECRAKFPVTIQFELLNVLMEWKRAEDLIESKVREYSHSTPLRLSQKTMLDDEDVKPADSPSLHVCIDIGGNREVESLLVLVNRVQDRLKPKSLIVKSKELFDYGNAHGGLDSGTAWGTLQSIAKASLLKRRARPLPSQDTASALLSSTTITTQSHLTQATRKHESHMTDPSKKKKYHPLKMPQRYNVEGIAICRYHNYDVHKGCLLFQDTNQHGKKCLLDHDHCHVCLERGHVAWECSSQEEPLVEGLL